MEPEILQKLETALKPTNHVGLVLPERLGVDEICAAQALAKKLEYSGKRVTIFSSAKNLPQTNFFKFFPKLYRDFTTGNEFVIRVSSQHAKPKQLRYEKIQDDLLIYLTPESGRLTEQDIELLPQAGDLDILIILGVSSLELIGSLYSNHTEVFFNTPKIVINNKIDQEYFGVINWIENSVSSLSEQLAQWLLSDEQVAKEDVVTTGLLAGIIDSTQSFRDPKTTPQTLAVAAELVQRGARRQEIIQHLFKTKSFVLLQLWGRALARIKTVPEQSLLYTLLTELDFSKTEAGPELLPQVLGELVVMASSYQVIVIAAKLPTHTELYLAGKPHIKLRRLARQISPTQEPSLEPLNGQYYFVKLALPNYTLEQAEAAISNLQVTSI